MSYAYIAGFFDGEGSIYTPMGVHHKSPKVQIPQSGDEGKAVLTEILEFLAAQGIDGNMWKSRFTSKIGKRPMYTIEIGKRAAVLQFLKSIFPYLRVKKVKAQDTIRFISMFPSTRGILQREHHARRRALGIPYHHARRVVIGG